MRLATRTLTISREMYGDWKYRSKNYLCHVEVQRYFPEITSSVTKIDIVIFDCPSPDRVKVTYPQAGLMVTDGKVHPTYWAIQPWIRTLFQGRDVVYVEIHY